MNIRISHAALLIACLLIAFVQFGAAQTEVEVKVVGPWSYVADPMDSARIIVIAPNEQHHYPAAISSGGDVIEPSNDFPVRLGRYDLDIPNLAPCKLYSSSAKVFPLNNVDVDSIIKPLIKGPAQRYAFSLPKPCYYTDKMENRSIIDPSSPITSSTSDAYYTTWMVLHYSVTGIPTAALKGTSDDGKVTYNKPEPFRSGPSVSSPAISVVMRAPSNDPYPNDCDSISAASVRSAAALFNRPIHVWLPSVDEYGNQAEYVPGCQDNLVDQVKIDSIKNAADLLIQIVQIERYARNPTPKFLSPTLEKLNNIKQRVDRLTPKPPRDVLDELKNASSLLQEIREGSEKSPARLSAENAPPLAFKNCELFGFLHPREC